MKSFIKVKAERASADQTENTSKVDFYMNKEAILAFYRSEKTAHTIILKSADQKLIEGAMGFKLNKLTVNKTDLK